jgi:hypothetical protein
MRHLRNTFLTRTTKKTLGTRCNFEYAHAQIAFSYSEPAVESKNFWTY